MPGPKSGRETEDIDMTANQSDKIANIVRKHLAGQPAERAINDANMGWLAIMVLLDSVKDVIAVADVDALDAVTSVDGWLYDMTKATVESRVNDLLAILNDVEQAMMVKDADDRAA